MLFFKYTTDSNFTSGGKHLPIRTTQKLVKLVLPVENLMYSSVNLDGGYMKRSFVCSQWFLLSSETTASRVANSSNDIKYFANDTSICSHLKHNSCATCQYLNREGSTSGL